MQMTDSQLEILFSCLELIHDKFFWDDRSRSGLEGQGIISVDEIVKFRKLVENYRLEINGVYDPEVDPEIFKEATQLAKKEIQKEAVEEMKKELINSRLPLPQNAGRIQKVLE